MTDWWPASVIAACLLGACSGYRSLMALAAVYGIVVLTLWFVAAYDQFHP